MIACVTPRYNILSETLIILFLIRFAELLRIMTLLESQIQNLYWYTIKYNRVDFMKILLDLSALPPNKENLVGLLQRRRINFLPMLMNYQIDLIVINNTASTDPVYQTMILLEESGVDLKSIVTVFLRQYY